MPAGVKKMPTATVSPITNMVSEPRPNWRVRVRGPAGEPVPAGTEVVKWRA